MLYNRRMFDSSTWGGGGLDKSAKVEKPAVQVSESRLTRDLKAEDIPKLRGLKNAIKKRHLLDLKRESWHDLKIFSKERDGAMFAVDGDIEKGFLGLVIDREKGTARIKSLRVPQKGEHLDIEALKKLVRDAKSYLREESIGTVSIEVSEELEESKHVLIHDLDFGTPKTGEEGILEASTY